MQYFQEEQNKIRAGFALNAGRLIAQYTKVIENFPANEHYDVTLAICILQALSTNCSELIDEMKKNNDSFRDLWGKRVPDLHPKLGLKGAVVEKHTFYEDLTYGAYITHIRNGLCHPTFSKPSELYETTGYTTRASHNDVISNVIIIDSPWVCRGKLLSKYVNGNETKINAILNTYIDSNSIYREKMTELEVAKNINGKFQIYKSSPHEPYYPIFKANFPIQSLNSLARNLANYLAQPAIDGWNGQEIRELCVA